MTDRALDRQPAPRLRSLVPAELDAEQAAVYEAIAGGPRAVGAFGLLHADGALAGPFNAMLYSPAVGMPLQELGAALRYRTSLSDRAREIAILIVAAQWDSAFERYVHETIGRRCGLTENEMARLAAGEPLELEDPYEQAVHDVMRQLVLAGDLGDDAYAQAREKLGEQTLMELTTVAGYYAMLALQLRVFRVSPPET